MKGFEDDNTLAFWWGVLSDAALDRPARKFWAQNAELSPAIILLDLVRDDPERAERVVVSIINQAQDDWILECVGAGPIEGLFSTKADAWRVLSGLGADPMKTRVAVNNSWLPEQKEAS